MLIYQVRSSTEFL
uniref:Uncharacterized protein n=1 Tax=Anguilla anguilla TaxID=7936 RepID=A0A0E9PD58_ANGAN